MSKLFPAVFLDRDGVICKEKSYITSLNRLEIYPYAADAVKNLRNAGFKTIIVTNQSAVARGMIKEEELKLIHRFLLEIVPVDAIYYCPHYPAAGQMESPYLINCRCRKPEPGMIYAARDEHKIDLGKSYIVGDRASDIIAGKNAGVTTVLVRTGYGAGKLEQDVQPDYIFKDLKEFTDFLIKSKVQV
ncbi:MAG: D-glycero-alpha-D-manno-heptose-1,7-bisphosphate 7-phosphatase [Bacillota bacterium]